MGKIELAWQIDRLRLFRQLAVLAGDFHCRRQRACLHSRERVGIDAQDGQIRYARRLRDDMRSWRERNTAASARRMIDI
jgi:hypothetical protein